MDPRRKPQPPLPPERHTGPHPVERSTGPHHTLASAFVGLAPRQLDQDGTPPWEEEATPPQRSTMAGRPRYLNGNDGQEPFSGWSAHDLVDSGALSMDFVSSANTIPGGLGSARRQAGFRYSDSYDLRQLPPPPQRPGAPGTKHPIQELSPTQTTGQIIHDTPPLFPLLNLAQTRQLLRANLSIPLSNAGNALLLIQKNAARMQDRSKIVGGDRTSDLISMAGDLPSAMAAYNWTLEVDRDFRVYLFTAHPFTFLPGDEVVLNMLGMYFTPGCWLDYLTFNGITRVLFTRYGHKEVQAQIVYPAS